MEAAGVGGARGPQGRREGIIVEKQHPEDQHLEDPEPDPAIGQEQFVARTPEGFEAVPVLAEIRVAGDRSRDQAEDVQLEIQVAPEVQGIVAALVLVDQEMDLPEQGVAQAHDRDAHPQQAGRKDQLQERVVLEDEEGHHEQDGIADQEGPVGMPAEQQPHAVAAQDDPEEHRGGGPGGQQDRDADEVHRAQGQPAPEQVRQEREQGGQQKDREQETDAANFHEVLRSKEPGAPVSRSS